MNREDDSLESYIDDYQDWIQKDIPVNDGWIDEINYLSFLREEIHQKARAGLSESVASRIRLLDKEWQSQITRTLDKKFKYTDKPQENYPEKSWWWHIEKLDELSDAEKATL